MSECWRVRAHQNICLDQAWCRGLDAFGRLRNATTSFFPTPSCTVSRLRCSMIGGTGTSRRRGTVPENQRYASAPSHAMSSSRLAFDQDSLVLDKADLAANAHRSTKTKTRIAIARPLREAVQLAARRVAAPHRLARRRRVHRWARRPLRLVSGKVQRNASWPSWAAPCTPGCTARVCARVRRRGRRHAPRHTAGTQRRTAQGAGRAGHDVTARMSQHT